VTAELVAGGAVDRLAPEVGVTAVPGVLLDHVDEDPAQAVRVGLTLLDVVERRRGGVAVGTSISAQYADSAPATVASAGGWKSPSSSPSGCAAP
jgi:hypothetical protein